MTQSFSYTGQIVTWTVPTGVTSLTIEARGAEGGDVVNRRATAGKGAIVVARVSVTPGQALSVLVGQSLNGRSAGGGGSFVAAPGSAGAPTALVVAGGGGGASTINGNTEAKHGQSGTSGGTGGFAFSGNNNNPGTGGTNANGGGSGANGAGGGGGFIGNGGGTTTYPNVGGRSFTNGGAGGSGTASGSYGGGGSSDEGVTSGGGGGGYSGGGAGYTGVGGGGGSYYPSGTSLSVVSGITGNSGNGLVTISYTPPPTITDFTVGPGSACVGDAITASLTVGNVSGSYSYTLTETNSTDTYRFTTSDNPASIRFVYDSPGVRNYTLRVVSDGQETTAGPRTVTINALPAQYNVTGSGSYCANTTGQAVGLSGSQSGVNYQLLQSDTPLGSPLPGTGNALNFGPQPAGTYTVRATNTSTSCQQTMTGSAVITAAQPPTVTLSNDGPITCTKPSVTLTAGGGNTYTFSAGATQVTGGNTATVTAAGTYTVTATNATNGCSSFTTTSVSANTATPGVSNPSVTTATQNMAFSQTFTASGGTAPYSFRLDSGSLPNGLALSGNGALNGSPTQSGSFSFTVRATGANGCSGVGAVYTLTVNPQVTGTPTLTTPASGTITNSLPIFSGNAVSNSTVMVYVSGTSSQTLTTRTNAQGQFSVPANPTLASGNYSAYAVAMLDGQTTSTPSATNNFTVDSTAPSVSLSSAQVTNGATTTSATVAFSASFSEPVNGFTTSGISVSNGSVSNLTGNGTSYTFQVTATTAGQPTSVQVLANAAQDGVGNANTTSTTYGFTYQPTPTTFAITGARITDCVLDNAADSKRYRVSLQPQYAGQDTSQPTSFSVANELSATTVPGPYTLLLWGDNQQITLVAKQPNSAEARFAYRWQADCPAINGGTPPPNQPQPPTTTGIPNQSATVNQAYSLDVSPYFSDPTGQPLTYTSTALPAGLSLSGSVISGVPSQSGVYGITVTATDPDNLTVASSFQLTINGTPVNPPNPPAGFSITGARITDCVLDNAADSKRYQVSLQPQYAGQDTSQPISFSVANELSATTAPGPYTLYLWGDNQQITLVAKQPNSTEARFAYRWQADCPAINGAPRRGVQAEAGTGLQVRLLGNPVTDGQLRLELRGVAGQSAELRLLSPAGRLLSQTPIESVVEGEPLTLGVRADWGSLLLLQVSSGSQQQTLKVVQVR